MNKWEELLKMCGFKICPRGVKDKDRVWVNREPDDYLYPNKHWGKQPPATFENIVRYVLIKVPALDRNDLLIKWVWAMYVLEVDGDPVNDLIDILYEEMI